MPIYSSVASGGGAASGEVDTLEPSLGVHGDAASANTVQGKMGVGTDAASDASASAVKTFFAALRSLGTKIDAVDDLVDTEVGAISTLLTTVAGYLDTEIAAIAALVASTPPDAVARQPGRRQVLSFSVTAAANAGVTTVATGTTAAFFAERVLVKCDENPTTDWTDAVLAMGDVGTENVIMPITQLKRVDGLSAKSKSTCSDGGWLFEVGDLLTIDPSGAGATALDLTVIVVGYAVGAGGYLA